MNLRHFDALGMRAARYVSALYGDCDVTFYSGVDASGQLWAGVMIQGSNDNAPVQYGISGVPLLLTVAEERVEQELVQQMSDFVQHHASQQNP